MKKKTFLTLITLLSWFLGFSQNVNEDKVEVIVCSEFRETLPLKDMNNTIVTLEMKRAAEKKEAADRVRKIPFLYPENPVKSALAVDGALQSTMGSKVLEGPMVNFDGQISTSYPPDPTGAAGLNYYVQAINSEYQIFTKTGGTVSSGGPYTLGSILFNSNDGDPIVLYDKYADRWFIAEFKSSGNKVLIGISKTPDPTGAYYTYQFTSPQFPDYLKFSIWADGYYMTSNQTSQKVFVFERDSMLAGVAGSRSIYKTFSPPNGSSFFCPLTGDADGQLPPAGTPCPIFSYEDDNWGGSYTDRINIYKMSVNWGTTPTATITLDSQLPVAAFDASYNSNWNDITQPNTTKKLDGIGGVFTFRAQYRRWTGYNSVVLNHVVIANPTTSIRGIRWYELRQNVTTGVWTVYQQGTYSPDNQNRWCGSIAMDDNGSIGMAYAVSGSSVYPSIRYTGRESQDTLGKMTFKEYEAATGNSVQTSTNRFGDYSHTSLDPADGTILWHTGEYLKSNDIYTKIFSFKIPKTNIGIDNPAAELVFNAYQLNSSLIVDIKNLTNDKILQVDLFDINGKLIQSKSEFPVAGILKTTFSTEKLAKGTYLIRIGNFNSSFQKVKKVVVI